MGPTTLVHDPRVLRPYNSRSPRTAIFISTVTCKVGARRRDWGSRPFQYGPCEGSVTFQPIVLKFLKPAPLRKHLERAVENFDIRFFMEKVWCDTR